MRQLAGFDLVQLFAEFRALRASVMAFWQRSKGAQSGSASSINEITLFNEGMDKALAHSVQRYSSEVAASRDMFLAVLGHGGTITVASSVDAGTTFTIRLPRVPPV